MNEGTVKLVLSIALAASTIFASVMAYLKWGVKATKETQTAKDEVQNISLAAHKEFVNLQFKQSDKETNRNSDNIEKIFTLFSELSKSVLDLAANTNKILESRVEEREEHTEIVSLLTEEVGILRAGKKDQAEAFKGALKLIADSTSLLNESQVQADIKKHIQEAFGEDVGSLKTNMDIIMKRSNIMQEMMEKKASASNVT